jgi:hypothetical protein
MLLSEYYMDSKNRENGKSYEIIEAGKNQRDYFTVKCTVCGDVRKVIAYSILSGRKPCSCSPKPKVSVEELNKRLKNKVELLGCSAQNISVVNAKSSILLDCPVCKEGWKTSYNSVVLKGAKSCPDCANAKKLSETKATSIITKKLIIRNIKLLSFNYEPSGFTADHRLSLCCGECSHVWETSYASISGGRGCPKCGKYGFQESSPAFLYILRIVRDEILIGYKFGISYSIPQRIKQHNKSCSKDGVTFHLSYQWYYEDGALAALHERRLKAEFNNYFLKSELSEGFTETFPITSLGDFITMQTGQYKKECSSELRANR